MWVFSSVVWDNRNSKQRRYKTIQLHNHSLTDLKLLYFYAGLRSLFKSVILFDINYCLININVKRIYHIKWKTQLCIFETCLSSEKIGLHILEYLSKTAIPKFLPVQNKLLIYFKSLYQLHLIVYGIKKAIYTSALS